LRPAIRPRRAAVLVFLALGHQHLRVLEWWLTHHLTNTSRQAWRLCQSAAGGARVAAFSLAMHFMTVAWGAAIAAHATVDFAHVLILFLPVP